MAVRRVLLVSIGLVCIGGMPVAAQGLLDLHDKVRVGSKLCLADHYHDGSSSGHKTRDAAEAAAVKTWQEFTAWEYGSAWGNFWIAANRGVKCDQSGGGWSCNVQAKPCKRR